jgi:class 3 adenylate cyclase
MDNCEDNLGSDETPQPESLICKDVETAHVLFVDIVGYSKLLIDEQTRQLQTLQEIVLATTECRRIRTAGDLIRLPTGDGLALVFFTDPEAPVRAAVEIARALKGDSKIHLRMGIHSGFVNRIADINTNMNVAGGGINIAQRVMDCGDKGHILLSKRVADDLIQLARWSKYLADLGDAEVKHGVVIHLFNLRGADFGNPHVPNKLRKLTKKRSYKTAATAIAVVIAIVGLFAVLWYRQPIATTTEVDSSKNAETSVPEASHERALVYWLLMQKTRNNKLVGDPFPSAGDVQYEKDWKLQFNVQPAESGALYLLNAGRGKDGAEKYNILYPIPTDGKINPNLVANQTAQTTWLQFMDDSAIERIWIIWSTKSLPDLNAVFGSAAENGGVITNTAHLERIRNYIGQYGRSKLIVEIDKSRQLTSMKGHGEILVGLLELSRTGK